MSNIVRSTSTSNVVRKKPDQLGKVTLSRVATDLRYMADVSFGELNESQDGKLVSYDSAQNKFVLITPDEVLIDSVVDDDVPDDFVRNLEDELDIASLTEGIDGGSF